MIAMVSIGTAVAPGAGAAPVRDRLRVIARRMRLRMIARRTRLRAIARACIGAAATVR